MELLSHMFPLFKQLFSRTAAPFSIPITSVRGFQLLRIVTDTCYYVFLITTILVGVQCYLTEVLITFP